MPITKSAKKKVRQDIRRAHVNRIVKRTYRDAVREVADAVEQKDKAAAEKALPAAYKQIDMAAKKNIMTKNTAARRKSRLVRMIRSLEKSAK